MNKLPDKPIFHWSPFLIRQLLIREIGISKVGKDLKGNVDGLVNGLRWHSRFWKNCCKSPGCLRLWLPWGWFAIRRRKHWSYRIWHLFWNDKCLGASDKFHLLTFSHEVIFENHFQLKNREQNSIWKLIWFLRGNSNGFLIRKWFFRLYGCWSWWRG